MPMSDNTDTVGRMMQQANQWRDGNDNRCIFLHCYATMSGNMKKALIEGRFADANWVDKLLEHFASYYFKALHQFEHHAPEIPAVWQHAFAEAANRHHVLQYMLLGVNAHINYDLPLALYDMLNDHWQTADETLHGQRIHDHNMVNTIIAETIDLVQDEVIEFYDPSMDIVDKLMGRVDEWILTELISSWRAHVWLRAMQLLQATTEEQREVIRLQIEADALDRARSMLLI